MAKTGKPMNRQPWGMEVIKLRQESEWKALPFWTHNTLQPLITDMDKQMSGYHSQHACFIVIGKKKPFHPNQVNNSLYCC